MSLVGLFFSSWITFMVWIKCIHIVYNLYIQVYWLSHYTNLLVIMAWIRKYLCILNVLFYSGISKLHYGMYILSHSNQNMNLTIWIIIKLVYLPSREDINQLDLISYVKNVYLVYVSIVFPYQNLSSFSLKLIKTIEYFCMI